MSEPTTIDRKALGRRSRSKGAVRERQLVAMHKDIGIHAERVPLSGAARYQGNGADVDIYAFGKDNGPLVGEVKARATGGGFKQIEAWLNENDCLFLMRDQEKPGQLAPAPLVVLPFATWKRLIERTAK
ncbi:hypothetical protein [Azospirillum sp.]|uniref:hypothetical protein n=1 Tax=Azospirillum sp. TaxID=34012 RepID=UPI003D70BD4C